MQPQTFPTRDVLRRLPFGMADVVLILGTMVLLYSIAQVGAGMLEQFQPPDIIPAISLDPRNLPYYAARSTLRMFIALMASFLFTFVYGYAAAHSRRAEQVLIPLLDVLQSVPVLGFLAITVTGFIALFPGSLLGLEAAAVFAIFTSQVWNMTFTFYQSLKTLPRELDEAAALYRLSRWHRFTKVEVPTSMIGLIWNAMMSFGGGWFFLAASEAISVLNQEYTLPGVGSYVAAAIVAQDMAALGWALLTIAIVIVLVDQLFWRPLIAWSDKFKIEQSAAAEAPQSWLLNLLRSARIPRRLGHVLAPAHEALNMTLARLTPFRSPRLVTTNPAAWSDRLYNGLLILVTTGLVIAALRFILTTVGLPEVGYTALLGLVTLGRVMVLLVVCTLIWTPIGVAIGFNPGLARLIQPVVQFLASFPANFLFPFATIMFIQTGISLNWGGILLMALGAQWYILFNTIAGAMSIPTDLREMAASLGLTTWQRWRTLIIPSIFSAWVTGALTAAGGAWNASIIAEIVAWGDMTLEAFGLGAYITEATVVGDWPRIVLGVGMMVVYVVAMNRLLWRKLYILGETKYRLE